MTENGNAYDLERTKIIESYGIRIVRFKNEEVYGDMEGVLERILYNLKLE
jgi:very-short-patch-repair endonuclease